LLRKIILADHILLDDAPADDDKGKEKIKALDEGDIALLKTYVCPLYAILAY
jgi:hypothetical protein